MSDINQIIYYFSIYLIIVNIISFITMYIDKYRAKKGVFRISENTFMILSFLGGTYGIIYAMLIYRHKTKHPKFYIGIPVVQIVHIIILVYVIKMVF